MDVAPTRRRLMCGPFVYILEASFSSSIPFEKQRRPRDDDDAANRGRSLAQAPQLKAITVLCKHLIPPRTLTAFNAQSVYIVNPR